MNHDAVLLRRIRVLTGFFIVGLLLSGVTAIPLVTEVDWLVEVTRAESAAAAGPDIAPGWAVWMVKMQSALRDVSTRHPFLFYGTDWLAFGHIVIALAFIGAWRDPVRNRWLFDFGLLACLLVIPWAMIFGGLRGIPVWWRLIDCAFGVVGFVPLWFCRVWSRRL